MVKKIFVFVFLLSLSLFGKQMLDLPRYQPLTRVDDDVLNFLKEQDSISKKSMNRVVKNKTTRDILGRLSKDTSIYVLRENLIEKKLPVGIIDLNQRNKKDGDAIEFYRNQKGDKFIRLNGKEIFFEDYRKIVQMKADWNEKEWTTKPFIRYENLTAQEIRNLIFGSQPVYVFLQKKLYKRYDDSYYHYSFIFGYTGVDGMHSVGAKGSGVGLFFEEDHCPDVSELNISYFDQFGSCSITGLHATKVAKLLQLTAPEAMVCNFIGNDSGVVPTVANYANQYNPKLEIGSYSWHYIDTPWADSVYSYTDQNLDQHIYEKRLIYFVAAGNMANSDDVYVGSPGKALNAITVGAVHPHTGQYIDYSKWKNSELRNQKPEIANYTNFAFDSPSLGHLTGTSASTPYSAAIAANILSVDTNLKRHPEVIKSIYLVNATIPISGNTHDEDDFYSVSSSLPYFDVNESFLYRWWSGPNDAFFDSNEKIVFTETGVVSGVQCRAAISWLTSGSYAGVYKSLAQDIDLFVYQGSTNPIGSSQSIYNPFEVVSFTTQSSADLRFEIKRFANSQSDDIALGFTMRCDNE